MTENSENPPLGVELVAWHWLRPHQQRDALWVVTAGLDLEIVGTALTRDNAAAVRAWLADGSLSKPQPEQLDRWEGEPEQSLAMLIVQPFVLVQERTLN
ncbi:MAG: DUF2288 family protein [Desulfuromonadales bacterium]|nr:DUF2288 family protein [Desulfuromonadales bacterium]